MTIKEMEELACQAVYKVHDADGVWPDKGACGECFYAGTLSVVRGLYLLGKLNLGGEEGKA